MRRTRDIPHLNLSLRINMGQEAYIGVFNGERGFFVGEDPGDILKEKEALALDRREGVFSL